MLLRRLRFAAMAMSMMDMSCRHATLLLMMPPCCYAACHSIADIAAYAAAATYYAAADAGHYAAFDKALLMLCYATLPAKDFRAASDALP